MRERFAQLSAREQKVVIIGSIVLTVIIVLRFVWWPLLMHIDHLHEALDEQADLYAWMQPRVARLAEGGAVKAVASKTITELERSLKQGGLQSHVQHVEARGDQHVTIDFSALPMPVFLKWLDQQSAAGWRVDQLTLKPTEKSGVADIIVVLS